MGANDKVAAAFHPADEFDTLVIPNDDETPLGENPCLPPRGAVVYIAGPMTGLPEFNYPAFKAAAAELRARGIVAKSPTEVTANSAAPDSYTEEKPYGYYLRRSLRMLLDCDQVVMLPGWENSRGATLERTIAEHLGMPITEWPS